jgi:hypothetical protein
VYNLADHLEGHKVRCKKCQAIISVGNGAARSEEKAQITAAPERRPKAAPARLEEKEAPPRRRKSRDDDRPRKSGGNTTLLIVGGVLAFVFLLCLGIGGGVFYFFWGSGGGGVGQAAKDMLVDVSGPWPEPMPLRGMRQDQVVIVRVANCSNPFVADEVRDRLGALMDKGSNFSGVTSSGVNDRMTVMIAPVRDVQAMANKIDFGTVRSVKDRMITMVAHDVPGVPAPNADQVTIALYRLKLPRSHRRAEAARTLKGMQPDATRREEVRKALEAVIDDPDQGTRNEVCEALGVWGTKETVPVLVKQLKNQDFGTRLAALRGLVKLKDPSATEAIATCLVPHETRGEAANALRTIGPSAEPIVVKYLKSDDPRVKEEACHILEMIGSQKSIPAVEELLNDRDASVSGTAKRTIEILRNKR